MSEVGDDLNRRNNKQGASTVEAPELEPPSELRAITFEDGENRYLMLSFALDEAAPPPSLTSAEREVLEAVLEGHSNASIAERRGTSSRTVANQVASLFRKFGASSRLDLARRTSHLYASRQELEAAQRPASERPPSQRSPSQRPPSEPPA